MDEEIQSGSAAASSRGAPQETSDSLGVAGVAVQGSNTTLPFPRHSAYDQATLELVRSAQKEILHAYRQEFDNLTSTFRDLDAKAQGNVAIAGIFLAATLAFVKSGSGHGAAWSKILLSLTLLSLVGSILTAIFVLRVRKIASIPPGVDFSRIFHDISRSVEEIGDDGLKKLNFFAGDVAKLWHDPVDDRKRVNEQKARLLRISQLAIAAAAILAFVLIVATLLTT